MRRSRALPTATSNRPVLCVARLGAWLGHVRQCRSKARVDHGEHARLHPLGHMLVAHADRAALTITPVTVTLVAHQLVDDARGDAAIFKPPGGRRLSPLSDRSQPSTGRAVVSSGTVLRPPLSVPCIKANRSGGYR